MRRPDRAVVLGAGFGSRLAPLTLDVPKPLIPVRGKPMIAHQLEQLASWGVKEVLVNLHHLADRMQRDIPKWVPKGMNLNFSHEPDLLGTGGALRRMAWFVEKGPFWMCNADVLQTVNPHSLCAAFETDAPLSVLWMVEDAGPKTVEVRQGRVVDFRGGGLTFSGVHLLSPEVLEFIPEEETFFSIIAAYEIAMAAGRRVSAVTVPGSRWADVGTVDTLLEANGGSLVCPGATVDGGQVKGRAVVGPGARIRRGREVAGMVVSPERGLDAADRTWIPDAEAVELLPARGSDRTFVRVHRPHEKVILVKSGADRPENQRFAGHARFLRRNRIRVPNLLKVSRDKRRLLMEDVGREHLLDRLREGSPRRNAADMRKVLKMTAHLHTVPVKRLPETEAPFSAALFQWEWDLFETEFLDRYAPGTPQLGKTPDLAAAALLDEPAVPVHRDLQSTNILWYKGNPVLIDFQGMRPGPAAYDLASLLADPYVNRSREQQCEALDLYNQWAQRPVSEAMLAHGVVRRMLQALGAYGRLGSNAATRGFLRHIPAALHQVSIWVPHTETGEWAKDFLVRHPAENRVGWSPHV